MTLTDKLHRAGFQMEQSISGEVCSVEGNPVVACINTEPCYLEMLESGYLEKEPLVFEILKGHQSSTEFQFIDGLQFPSDLRGQRPHLLKQITYPLIAGNPLAGKARKMMRIHDASDRWIITTIVDNVKNPQIGRI